MCLYPKIITNKKYTSTKKNGGNIPPVIDQRVTQVPIGCGNCIECRKQKAREWKVRLLEDVKENRNGKFITLTFSNESIRELSKLCKGVGYQRDNEIATLAMRRFLERWRKKYKKSLRHWVVTELGHSGTEHLHMHGIIWTDEPLETVEQIWAYGWMWKGKMVNGRMQNYVNGETVGYIVKYVTKMDELHKTYKPIVLTSPGIGNKWSEGMDAGKRKYQNGKTNETYRMDNGMKVAMPVYWRNKIYSEEEREKLWLQKLDKQVRYVMGEKVDISKGEEQYNKLLKYYQRINNELGYGSDERNWTQEQYERERRIIKQKERINNKNNKEKIVSAQLGQQVYKERKS